MSQFSTTQASRIADAQQILRDLNFDSERSNQRSALVLLALADIRADTPWAHATNSPIGTRAIISWIAENYGVQYAPNTRETIRRFTLHQFVEAGVVVENPDEPTRPINSPKWCYILTDQVTDVLRSIGSHDLGKVVSGYLSNKPGLLARYKAARNLVKIPVVLPSGSTVELSPGGQNKLIKLMLEEFSPRFTPNGQVLYIGDAARKSDEVYEVERLAELGVVLPDRGKKPDLVVYMPDRNWIVLMEAASSHGPVDGKRHGELKELFAGTTAGLVFISCFLTRADMRKYSSVISWETDVWCAEDPDHLIHFDGQRFLGPY